MTIGNVHAEYLSVCFQALCVREGRGREENAMTRLFFFLFLLLAGLFGGIGIFYRNKEKKKLTARQNRGGLFCRIGKEFAKPERGSVCASPSCSVHTHHRAIPSAPRIPMGECPAAASRTGFRGGLSSSISLISLPGSLSMSLHVDRSPRHHPGRGEPREDAAHPLTTSTVQPGPLGCAPPVCPLAAGLRCQLPFGKANRLLNKKQCFAEEEEAAAG